MPVEAVMCTLEFAGSLELISNCGTPSPNLLSISNRARTLPQSHLGINGPNLHACSAIAVSRGIPDMSQRMADCMGEIPESHSVPAAVHCPYSTAHLLPGWMPLRDELLPFSRYKRVVELAGVQPGRNGWVTVAGIEQQ